MSNRDREAAAWSVTCAAGLASGVILGIEPSAAASAWMAVAIIVLIATCACSLLLGPQLRATTTA